nr:GNAT family N-acetyltransferase [Streptomyces cavernae]
MDHPSATTFGVEDGGGDAFFGMGQFIVDGCSAEVSLIVEDRWQNQGVGSLLLRHMQSELSGVPVEKIYGVFQHSNRAIPALLRHLELPLTFTYEGAGDVTVAWKRGCRPVEVGATDRAVKL